MAFVLGLYFGSILCNRQIGLDVHWEFGSGNILRNKSHFTHSKILLLICKKCLSNKPFIVTNINKPAFHFLWFMPLKWSVQCPRVHPNYWFGHLWQLAKIKMQSLRYRKSATESRVLWLIWLPVMIRLHFHFCNFCWIQMFLRWIFENLEFWIFSHAISFLHVVTQKSKSRILWRPGVHDWIQSLLINGELRGELKWEAFSR